MIHIWYDSIDGVHKAKSFKTIVGAMTFAHKWVGSTPDVGENSVYAVSFDGVGRIMWQGVDVRDLFPSSFSKVEVS